MIGRAALGNPWVFSPEGIPTSLAKRMTGLKRHLELIQEFSNTDKILPKIKNQAGRYFKGIAGGSTIRMQIYQAGSFDEIQKLTQSL